MSHILIETENAVTTIAFNRPEKKNSFSHQTYTELAEALADASADPAVRVVVFQGSEAIFSAGNDLQDFAENPPQGTDAPVWRFLEALTSFTKPLIAAACGPAVGIGTTMLLHCDLVYLGENAKLMLPFTSLGVCPEAASSLLLPQLLGHRRASEVLYFGETILPDEALRAGLANAVLPPEQVAAHARQQAQRLAARPATAIQETRRLLKRAQLSSIREQMAAESEAFGALLTGPAAKEAFAAFFEGRSPDFSGL